MLSGRYTYPSSSSALKIVHPLTLPVYSHERFSHVSFPTSPGHGTVLKTHFSLPVRASQPRVHPATCSFLLLYDEIDAGVMTVFRTTMGGDCTE